jgi:hypothetical protein
VASELYKEGMASSDLRSGNGTGGVSCFSTEGFSLAFTSFSGAKKKTRLILYVLVYVETPDFFVGRMDIDGLSFFLFKMVTGVAVGPGCNGLTDLFAIRCVK